MNRNKLVVLQSAFAGAFLTVGAAHAALPAGMDTVATEVITNIGLAAALGASIAVVALGTSIAFDVAKRFIRKGAK